MAEKEVLEKKETEEKKKTGEKRHWTVAVKENSDFCGIGAGGVQFANGRAEITSARMAEWFREHEGYEVH